MLKQKRLADPSSAVDKNELTGRAIVRHVPRQALALAADQVLAMLH
jgi:hypothetical protein